MNVSLKIVPLVLVLFLCACQLVQQGDGKKDRSQREQGSAFVSVNETQFIRYGKPYYFVGANFWYGAYLGASSDGRQRLIQELDQLKALGVDNLRVLAISEKTSLKMAVSPGIHTEPGVLDESLLQGLDILLDELAKRDMVAVLYLNNFWQWSGGMSQYRAWITGAQPFDPDVTGDWNGFMQNSALFYADAQAQSWYRQAIKTIINRKNTVNGNFYKEDPVIMSWQLANEPRPGSDRDGLVHFPDYKRWLTDTASFIKNLDAKHLVSTGSEGEMGALRDIKLYKEAHQSNAIDYLTFHLWPKNWSWLDINNTQATYNAAMVNAKAYVLRHVAVAKELNKPTVLEEFGVERDLGAFSKQAPTSVRDQFYGELFALIETQAKMGAPIAGSNFWAWGGLGEAKHSDFIWQPGDPFTGDPPQEAQGLNSIFSQDASTLEVIRDHARVMQEIE